ncbi:phosphatidylinositol transfer protein csr1 [Yamadazyma tenuis]|uniref:CRAL-TRIO domain-containing protein n=1 Tax=Candida tenuis (strain ATCC 10573 / BCRC 21748 / CBS 615 / JCM 9827 / NBRC 10315 / NRRL Y-1498 / VKM Y-70) TaxID=590646 RepID=G3BAG9_CANTC|nr:uncharacterized protein CANTEDRAFT_115513 [Yamadazyma tenuis ATCC 10573]XP_006688935.1 uncharacterized protein CANTEDRAFT_115513 [Yamadazyma tenuis ATCC 10573]EGV62764.1 hypothetical protein CANTEDRAFT_115513 [Yamadazyma tenuis ATCC 10573]EGV62765.1 hypothetical protein CANTEDRAFT_115513 [Yamadazyma tenuis ATCC 10573]WEJ93305.1 phosphatidylinositol transfer protein csr1 [Yamadazyma tenuis]
MSSGHHAGEKPGRIQSINADQEIVLKQVWAYIFRFFGYQLEIDDEDLAYKECFVSSTRCTQLTDSGFGGLNYGLVRTGTKDSTTSSHISHKTSASTYSTLNKKKKSGILKRGGNKKIEVQEVRAPATSKRMKYIQSNSSFEKYTGIAIDPKVAYVYNNFYKSTFENSEDYMSDNEDYGEVDDDDVSISSFFTAETYVDEPDMKAFVSAVASSMNKSASASYLVEEIKVKPNTSLVSGINKYDPKRLHPGVFGSLRNDAFDNYILRFVRARKFKTEDSMHMIFKALDWRTSEDYRPNEWENEGDAPSYLSGKNPGFIRNYTSQKSFVRGHDKERSPIFFFFAKKHLISESPLADTQRFAVCTIESCRLFLRDITDSVDTCSIVFDLTGFSLKNADYNAIKFLAEVFEAYYPECLGKVLIFNAPWIFSTVWNVIKNWLDPVVASKIHFAKDFKELNKFIDREWIPKSMGGDDDYDGEYPVPTERDGHFMKQRDGDFSRLMRKRDEVILKFLSTTKKWIEATDPEISDKYLQDKINLCGELAYTYIQLDPYLRYPGFYDRNGSLQVSC